MTVDERKPTALVGDWLDALNRRDLEALLELSDDEVDLRPLRMAGLEPRYQGQDALRRWFHQILRLRPEQQVQLSELREAPDGRVIAIGSLTLGSEELVVGPFTGLYEVAGGRVTAAHHYLSDPDLIEHLGLI